jgi:hypothetical protein
MKIFVITFDDWHHPKRLIALRFSKGDNSMTIYLDPALVKTEGLTKNEKLRVMILDEHEGRSGTSMAAGHLLPHGEVVIDEPIEWTVPPDEPMGDFKVPKAPEPPPAHGSTAVAAPMKLTIAEAKAGLAATFNVSPDAIKIIIEG